MNTLAKSALVIGCLLQAAGCIITTGDGDEAASFDVDWGTIEACPTGASAEVVSVDVLTNQDFVDIYNCTDGIGRTAPLPLGDYDVRVDIIDADGTTLLGSSATVAARLDFDGDVISVSVADVSLFGAFGFTWTLTNTGNDADPCAEVFASGVDIIATFANTSEATVDVFDCDAGAAVTPLMGLGLYTLVVDLLDADDAAIATSLARDGDLNQANVDLGNFEFSF